MRGRHWLRLKTKLEQASIRPIFPDALLIETKVEESFNVARLALCAQTEVDSRERAKEKQDEDEFFQSILERKEQELQNLVLQKKKRQPQSAMKARMEAKAQKEAILRKSSPSYQP